MSLKLKRLAKDSEVMDINITFGKDRVKFNLAEELKISENKINHEIKEQPTYYGFLAMLSTRLKRKKESKLAELEKTKAKKFYKYKRKIDPTTNRANSKEVALALTTMDKEYQRKLEEYNKAVEEYEIIKVATSAFEQRASLIQSLSANIRKETN